MRGVLTAPAEAWDLAVRRAGVIRELAAQRVVSLEDADAAARLGVSRRQVYVLVGRWRAGEGVASDLLPGTSSGGRRMRFVMIPQDTDGSAMAGHLALVWTAGSHTYAITFHVLWGVPLARALDLAVAQRLVMIFPPAPAVLSAETERAFTAGRAAHARAVAEAADRPVARSVGKIKHARLLRSRGDSPGLIAAKAGIPETSPHRYLVPAGQQAP
jgi:hypothetical protein